MHNTEGCHPSISVLLASYNGERYIGEQLNSVLPNLSSRDEIIVSDDGSTDHTKEIVQSAMHGYMGEGRAIVVDGPRRGVQKNFYHAALRSTGEIVLFCDQDDIWYPQKIEAVRKHFAENENTKVLLHDARIIDSDGAVIGDSLFKQRSFDHGFFRNLIKSGYFGCCMAVKREFLLRYADGFLKSPAYDQFYGLLAEKHGVSAVINRPLIAHRLHGSNVSHSLSIGGKVQFRLHLFISLEHSIRNGRENT